MRYIGAWRVPSLRIRLPKYGLRLLFLMTTGIAVVVGIAVPLFSYPPKILWRPLSVADVIAATDRDEVALVLVEGHPGGIHQYFVVESQLGGEEFRRFVHQNKMVTFRVNVSGNVREWQEFAAFMHLTDVRPPSLMLIRKNGEYECVHLDPNVTTNAVVEAVRLRLSAVKGRATLPGN